MAKKSEPSRNIMIPPQGGFIHDLVLRIKLILRLMGDRRVNILLKLLPVASLVYLFSPIDLIVLPVVGALDDAAVLWVGMYLFVELCPPKVVQEHVDALSSNLDILEQKNEGEVVDADAVETSDDQTS